jgi:hypothetical protein
MGEELSKKEQRLTCSKDALIACGIALREIRDSKLYRSTHRSFYDYCAEVHNLTRTRTRQLISFANNAKQ